jgi:hypothetical protein
MPPTKTKATKTKPAAPAAPTSPPPASPPPAPAAPVATRTDVAPAPPPVRIHPIAELFPKPSAEDYDSTKASVRAVGFRSDVTTWDGPDGLTYVIDGRTRYAIRDELAQQGVRYADNGALLEPTARVFVGSEREALEHVRAVNSRRNLSSSQKAAVAVIGGAMLRRLELKETGGDTTELKAEESGRLAERVAATAGTNRQYVYDVAALHQSHPELLDRIKDGTLTVPQAKIAAKRLASGQPAFDDGTTPPVETPVTVKATDVFDARRRRVHADFLETFGARKEVTRIRKELAKLVKDAQAVCDGPGGRLMVFSAIKTDVNNARAHLDQHQPHIVCPVCAGSGERYGGMPGEKCPTCAGVRYLDKLQYDELPENVRKQIEDESDATQTGEATATDTPGETTPYHAEPDTADTSDVPGETVPSHDPDATATREFAPGELTPDDWDASPEDVAAVAAELPDGDGSPGPEPEPAPAAPNEPPPADIDDPFAL